MSERSWVLKMHRTMWILILMCCFDVSVQTAFGQSGVEQSKTRPLEAMQGNKKWGENHLYFVMQTRSLESAARMDSKIDRSVSYSEHVLHHLAPSVLPGLQLDAHSKALLRMEPASPLVAGIRDSIYLARPGAALIHLIVEGKSRRTNIIPDSLFLVPEDRYIFGIQITRDLLLGRIKKYGERSSRIIGVFRMQVAGKQKIVVLSSHDYLNVSSFRSRIEPTVKNGPLNNPVDILGKRVTSDVSLAVFTPGLVFEDLVRIHLGQLGVRDVLPVHYGSASLTWKNEFGQDVVFQLQIE